MTIRPTLRQLQYLCALAEKKSFRGAAEACSVSQSTLSAGIGQLEEILQAGLVDRESDGFRLTRLGSEILVRAESLLSDADDLVALAQRQDAPLSGQMRLGVIPSIGPFLLPRALPGLRRHYPDLKLYLRETLTRALLDDVRAGRLDAAIVALPYQVSAFACQTLGTDRFQVALPLRHPLVRKEKVSVRDLHSQALILLGDGHCIRDHALSSLKRMDSTPGAKMGEEIEATSIITIVQMVANGLGVTLLPQIALRTGLVDGLDIVIRDLKEQPAERELAMVWRKKSAMEPNVRLLADYLSSFI
ncbi:hydrogen peroxide-inducible genes activator [Cohaesibacter celericrescens]|uniref:HTH lysR-type domain-containing protein n=1 Tax=Cohaesibacter celericrescens TaxID=2067669 RepID=A0A2N5XU64_9HYPH|nr:hydrogen peroxide-inducible genes activator [Cohaesibacter celericrescens]PLW78029.1 hypothetical protein C0081_06140 [Cohaesibacter celericrescens]